MILVTLYPVFESFDVTPLLRLRPQSLRVTRFVLDTHLGRLARYLRMLGFDSLYRNDYGDDELARVSSGDDRILLTRDVGLLKCSVIARTKTALQRLYSAAKITPAPVYMMSSVMMATNVGASSKGYSA